MNAIVTRLENDRDVLVRFGSATIFGHLSHDCGLGLCLVCDALTPAALARINAVVGLNHDASSWKVRL